MSQDSKQPDRLGPVIRQSGQMLPGTRPGDHRFRRGRRPKPLRIPLPRLTRERHLLHPAAVFVYGFMAVILMGAVLLSLPISSADGRMTGPLDALFTATSAVCVTGLTVLDTGTYWSPFGQAVILLLIQLGGLGFMTSSTLLLLILRREATLRHRILLRESLGAGGLGSILSLARRIVLFTIAAELIGAVVLTLSFLRHMDAPTAVWWGVFHAISAFNNAGFDLTGGFRSLVPFNENPLVLLPIAVLLVLGSISYVVVDDLIAYWRERDRLTLDTRLVLVTTSALIVIGLFGFLVTEWANGATLGALPVEHRVLNALVMSVSHRTAGFTPIDVAAITDNGLILIMALMFVGGSAGSTAGGIKVQTLSVMVLTVVATIRGTQEVEAFGRRIPPAQVFRALTVALLYLMLILFVCFLLNATESAGFLHILFETFSAFGTVGLSTGITPDISPAGRAVLIVAMFAGRLGPLTVALALAARERARTYHLPEEAIRIG